MPLMARGNFPAQGRIDFSRPFHYNPREVKIMTIQKQKTLDIVYIGAFTALIAICSWITIPSTVPFTMQTFAVFAAVGMLGGKRGTLAVLCYILLGALGAPVFAGFAGGLGALLGSTGGYIGGFLLSALVMWAMERPEASKLWLGLSMVLGLLVCYAAGTAWFLMVYTRSTGPVGLATVLSWCVVPFVVPDLLKIALAVMLTGRLKRFLK